MSSLMWPWPERMVSGLKPTKLSWLAVVQKKAPQPSCLSWMVLILMSRKQKRKRQTGHVFGCPKFVLRMRQLKKGARKASMEGEMKNLEESRRLANWLKAGSVTMAAELKQRDISWNNKLRENMSPAKEVMMLLVQSMKGPRRQE